MREILIWQESDFIPKLFEIIEISKNILIILLSFKNDAYRRILSA